MPVFSVDSNIPFLPEILKQTGSTVHIFENGKISNKELIQLQTNFLIVRSTVKVDSNLLNNTSVKFISTATTGIDHIDIEYLSQNNIDFYAPIGANSNSVAEYIIFSILFAFQNNLKTLQNKTVGIVGFGNIGTKVAHYLKKMNIDFIVCDPLVKLSDTLELSQPASNSYTKISIQNEYLKKYKLYDIDSIISQSDIITLHIPFTIKGLEPTSNLINYDRVQKIKNDSLLINTARGGICNEKAILEQKNRFRYIIDVWENEPSIDNRQLIKNAVIATPHIAGHSFNAKMNATWMICDKLNEIYKLNLDTAKYSHKELFNNSQSANIDFIDYHKMLDILIKARQLNVTSNEMKSKIELNATSFAEYFSNTRKNYPKIYETISVL